MAKFICSICGYIHEGVTVPEKCPICMAPTSKFSEIQETKIVEDYKEEDTDGSGKATVNESVNTKEKEFSDKKKLIHEIRPLAFVTENSPVKKKQQKYITTIKDLVIQSMTNGKEMKKRADSGEAKSCFQMGMRYLVGANVSISFEKAKEFFENKSLSADNDANTMLGFIAECEGDYSDAFKHYSTVGYKDNQSYIENVICGRNQLVCFLKNYNLPISLNSRISTTLQNYSKDKKSKIMESCVIASICSDASTCLEVAQLQYEDNNVLSSIYWLSKGDVEKDNSLYSLISKEVEEVKDKLRQSSNLIVTELKTNSLLNIYEMDEAFISSTKTEWKSESKRCKKEWTSKNDAQSMAIIKEKEKEWSKLRKKEQKEEAERKVFDEKVFNATCIVAAVMSVAVCVFFKIPVGLWVIIGVICFFISYYVVKNIMSFFS